MGKISPKWAILGRFGAIFGHFEAFSRQIHNFPALYAGIMPFAQGLMPRPHKGLENGLNRPFAGQYGWVSSQFRPHKMAE